MRVLATKVRPGQRWSAKLAIFATILFFSAIKHGHFFSFLEVAWRGSLAEIGI